MRFVLTYEDLSLWIHNFLDLDMQLEAYGADNGKFCITSPNAGIRKLVPDAYRRYEQYFNIEAVGATSVTMNILGIYGKDNLFYQLFPRYVNYCCMADVIEPIPHGLITIHLDRLVLTKSIELSSLAFSHEGLVVDFADNPSLKDRLRMIQQLLRTGYKRVHLVPDDMPYAGYWFADDTLEYTLVMTEHPADIRLCSSFHVMDWIGLATHKDEMTLHSVYPATQINYQYGDIKVSIPLTIPEPEINATTIQRNCKRLQEEIAHAMANVIDYLQQLFIPEYERL